MKKPKKIVKKFTIEKQVINMKEMLDGVSEALVELFPKDNPYSQNTGDLISSINIEPQNLFFSNISVIKYEESDESFNKRMKKYESYISKEEDKLLKKAIDSLVKGGMSKDDAKAFVAKNKEYREYIFKDLDNE